MRSESKPFGGRGGGKIPGRGAIVKDIRGTSTLTTSTTLKKAKGKKEKEKKYNGNKQGTIQLDPIRTKLSINNNQTQVLTRPKRRQPVQGRLHRG